MIFLWWINAVDAGNMTMGVSMMSHDEALY